jgi:hypothetical protein
MRNPPFWRTSGHFQPWIFALVDGFDFCSFVLDISHRLPCRSFVCICSVIPKECFCCFREMRKMASHDDKQVNLFAKEQQRNKIVGGRILVLCNQRLASRLVESGRVHGSGIAVLAADVSNRWMTWVSMM